jgi:putative AlgH/UPF0301 family transcriptional regulator
MRSGAWLTAEVTSEIVFHTPLEAIWDRTLRGLGIDPSMLVAGGGVH